jgi:hypothetical protein
LLDGLDLGRKLLQDGLADFRSHDEFRCHPFSPRLGLGEKFQ